MEIPTGWKEKLSLEYSRNQFACEIINGEIRDYMYKIVDEIIYYKDRIYLVPGSYLRKNILEVAHDSLLVGHCGSLKTYGKVRERFFRKVSKSNVLRHVRKCNIF